MHHIDVPPPSSGLGFSRFRSVVSVAHFVKPFISFLLLALGALIIIGIVNAGLTGEWRWALGQPGHTLMTAGLLAAFVLVFRKDKVDLLVALILWAVLLIPAVLVGLFAPAFHGEIKPYYRAIAEGTSWAASVSVALVVLSASSCFLRSKVLRIAARGLTVVLWAIALLLPLSVLFYWVTEGALLSASAVLAVLQTNFSESVEFLSFKGKFAVLAALSLFLFALLLRVVFRPPFAQTSRLGTRIALAVLLVLALFATSKTIFNTGLSAFFDAGQVFDEYVSYSAKAKERQVLNERLQSLGHEPRSGLYVFVVGESMTRTRMSAYGYEKNTTPWLDNAVRSGDVLLLRNAYSCRVNTVPALSEALTAKNQFRNSSLALSPSIVQMARAAGFDVWWISNQSRFGFYDTPTSVIASDAQKQIWLRENGAASDKLSPDGDLLPYLKKIPLADTGKTLVIIHLMGCHVDYKNRYPAEFRHWDDSGRDGAYDNAMRYTDHVVGEISQIVRKRSDFQGLFLMSDHGELVSYGHNEDHFTWSMAQIPVWFLFSRDFNRAHPEIEANLRQNAGKPFTNDMMFDTVCGILGLTKSSFYDQANDISSMKYARTAEELTLLGGRVSLMTDPDLRKLQEQ